MDDENLSEEAIEMLNKYYPYKDISIPLRLAQEYCPSDKGTVVQMFATVHKDFDEQDEEALIELLKNLYVATKDAKPISIEDLKSRPPYSGLEKRNIEDL